MTTPTNTRTIPQLPAGSTLTGSELLEISQNSVSANTSAQNIANLAPPFNINGLPNATTLTGSELTPVFQNNVTSKTTTQDIANLAAGITFTDGTNTVSGATQITISGGTIGGTTPDATLTISGLAGFTNTNDTGLGLNTGVTQLTGYNTYVGARAGQNYTGNSSVFIGTDAGNAIVTGNFNTIIGDNAQLGDTTEQSVVIGSYANYNGATTASGSVFIGEGVYTSGSAASNCILIGQAANTAGESSIAIGTNAGGNGSNSAAIGIGASTNSGGSLVIGNGSGDNNIQATVIGQGLQASDDGDVILGNADVLLYGNTNNGSYLNGATGGAQGGGTLNTTGLYVNGLPITPNSITLTADTNISAGTAASINSSGHMVQAWGPAPQVSGTATLFNGSPVSENLSVAILGPNNFIIGDASDGLQACSQSGYPNYTVSYGPINTDTPSSNVSLYGPVPNQISTGYLNIAVLNSSSFVLPYVNSSNLYVVVGTVNGSNVISYGTPVQVASDASSNNSRGPSIVALTSTSFVIAYSGSFVGHAVYGTVSGTTISLGTPLNIFTNSTPVLAMVSSSNFLFAWSYNELIVNAGTISGTSISIGSQHQIELSGNDLLQWLIPLSSNIFILGSASANNYAISVSGTSVTVGPATSIGTETAGAVALDSTHYLTWSPGQFVASVNTSTLDITLDYTFAIPPGDISVTGAYPNILNTVAAGFSNNLALVCGQNMRIYELDVSGNISLSINHQFLTNYWLYALDSTHALATFTDLSTIAYARVITINPIMPAGPVGFVSSAVAQTNTGSISVSGVVSGFSGLTPGQYYWVNGDGTLISANTGRSGGVAISSSQLLITPNPTI